MGCEQAATRGCDASRPGHCCYQAVLVSVSRKWTRKWGLITRLQSLRSTLSAARRIVQPGHHR